METVLTVINSREAYPLRGDIGNWMYLFYEHVQDSIEVYLKI